MYFLTGRRMDLEAYYIRILGLSSVFQITQATANKTVAIDQHQQQQTNTFAYWIIGTTDPYQTKPTPIPIAYYAVAITLVVVRRHRHVQCRRCTRRFDPVPCVRCK